MTFKGPTARPFFLTPREGLRWRDLVFILLSGLLWLGLVEARARLIQPRCQLRPETCTPSTVPAIDRAAIGLESPDADGASYFTQNTAGAVALAVPAAWHAATALLWGVSPPVALLACTADWALLVEATFWNGSLNETLHLITQRPRPFVYADPKRAGDPQNYTSFYSGHTSFAAVAGIGLLLILLSRSAPAWLLLLATLSAEFWVVSTAIFRVLAGRHFVSDVIVGALAGATVAMLTFLMRSKPPASPDSLPS